MPWHSVRAAGGRTGVILLLHIGHSAALRQILRALPEAAMNWRDHIWIDAERMHGLPCIRGTRIPIHVILDNLADGESVEAILSNYPGLRAEHVPVALAFAAELARERIVPIPS